MPPFHFISGGGTPLRMKWKESFTAFRCLMSQFRLFVSFFGSSPETPVRTVRALSNAAEFASQVQLIASKGCQNQRIRLKPNGSGEWLRNPWGHIGCHNQKAEGGCQGR